MQTFDVRREFQGGFTRARPSTRYIVVHHAAAFYAQAAGIDDVRAVARYHTGKGWSGIGYHIALAELTQGGPIAAYLLSDLNSIRAGVAHRNHETVHVSCLTNFGSQRPAQKWFDALIEVIDTQLRPRYPNAEIVGHTDIALDARHSPDGLNWSTACPGTAWHSWKPELLAAVDGAAAPILGPASGTVEQLVRWLAPRAHPSYTDYDLRMIAEHYRTIGARAGLDWFLAATQMAHETGNLTSFWSLRPQRNPAGLGVTGEHAAGIPDQVPITLPNDPATRARWRYNPQRARWEEGISFSDWASASIPTHIGRLLAYVLKDEQATPEQRKLIVYALSVRPLPASFRGVARTWTDLNGRWAVPGTTYGQKILALAQSIRRG